MKFFYEFRKIFNNRGLYEFSRVRSPIRSLWDKKNIPFILIDPVNQLHYPSL